MSEKVRALGALVVTVLIFLVLFWWLIVVAVYINHPAKIENGAISLDVFTRSKDILAIIFPLATTAVGFWLGNRGAEKAEEVAETATVRADASEEDARLHERLMHEQVTRAQVAEERLALLKRAARPLGPPDPEAESTVYNMVLAMFEEDEAAAKRARGQEMREAEPEATTPVLPPQAQ